MVDEKDTDSEAKQALKRLNSQFLKTHNETAQLKNKKIDRVIVSMNGVLSMWEKKDGDFIKVKEAIIPTPDSIYTTIKEMSHIQLLLMDLTKQYKEFRLSKKEFNEIILNLKKDLESILQGLGTIFTQDIIENQQLLLEETINAIQQMSSPLTTRETISSQLVSYLRKIDEVNSINMQLGSDDIIRQLHNQLNQWELIANGILPHTRVIIVAPHGPRIGDFNSQFFEQWYRKEMPEQDKIMDAMVFYVETMPSLTPYLDINRDLIHKFLLGESLNKSVGRKVLKNRYAMTEDILAKPADRAIKRKLDPDMDLEPPPQCPYSKHRKPNGP